MELEAAAVAFFPAADGSSSSQRRAPWGRTLLLHPHFLLALPLSNPDPEPVGKLDVKDPGSPDLLSLVAAVTTATSQTRHPSRACTGDVQETEVKADLPRLHLTLRGSNRQ
uniref:Cysteine synthase-like protein n=1 Tax=Oryza sativa subsp. indica TaxID=39946 RepID=G8FLF3_ORYSI|nr:cysteine synthase-like protein [Oryza sativa Indica Group]